MLGRPSLQAQEKVAMVWGLILAMCYSVACVIMLSQSVRRRI